MLHFVKKKKIHSQKFLINLLKEIPDLEFEITNNAIIYKN